MSTISQSPLVPIPSKRTEPVDFEEPFSQYIANVYGDDPSKYAQDIALLNRFRQDMKGAGADITGRDILYRYYGQLELLDLRFPIDEKRVKILFTWYDSFTNIDTSQYSVAYEKACVIYNIGANCSAIAAKQNRFEATGQKTAYNYFQAAAGMFQYINDNFLHPPSIDMSRDSINVIVDLCLAQAQEAFIEKVIAEKKKGALVAKLSAHCAHLYNLSCGGMLNPTLEHHFDESWEELVKIKSQYFQTMAHYHRAIQLEAEAKYGASVAHFTTADELAKEANKSAVAYSKSFQQDAGLLEFLSVSSGEKEITAVTSLVEMTKSLMSAVAEAKRIAVKDNDVIYHENVPAVNILDPIDKVSIVKCIPFADICTNEQADIPKIIGPDIFQKLIPLGVHESSSLYSEEKAKILRGEQDRSEAADQDLEVTIQSTDLVSTINRLKNLTKGKDIQLDSSLSLPKDLKACLEKIQQEESNGTSVNELLGILDSLKEKIKETVTRLPLQLDKEQHECESLRMKYGQKWSQTPSANLTQHFRQDLSKHKDAFDGACQADNRIMSEWDSIKNQVDNVIQPIEYIESMLWDQVRKATDTVSSSPVKQVSLIDISVEDDKKEQIGALGEQLLFEKIDGMLAKLRGLKKERLDLLVELKAKIHAEDISQILLINKGKETQVFQAELAKYKVYQKKMSDNLDAHRKYLRDLVNDFDRVKIMSKGTKILEVRERVRKEVIQQWQTTIAQLKKVKDTLQKGIEFYGQLSDMVESSSQGVHKFLRQRSQEKGVLVQTLDAEQAKQSQQSLREQLEKLNVSSSPSTAISPAIPSPSAYPTPQPASNTGVAPPPIPASYASHSTPPSMTTSQVPSAPPSWTQQQQQQPPPSQYPAVPSSQPAYNPSYFTPSPPTQQLSYGASSASYGGYQAPRTAMYSPPPNSGNIPPASAQQQSYYRPAPVVPPTSMQPMNNPLQQPIHATAPPVPIPPKVPVQPTPAHLQHPYTQQYGYPLGGYPTNYPPPQQPTYGYPPAYPTSYYGQQQQPQPPPSSSSMAQLPYPYPPAPSQGYPPQPHAYPQQQQQQHAYPPPPDQQSGGSLMD